MERYGGPTTINYHTAYLLVGEASLHLGFEEEVVHVQERRVRVEDLVDPPHLLGVLEVPLLRRVEQALR